MNTSPSFRIFTSESVSEGHPDKVCDQVSDAILDACLALDPRSHVACETAAGTDFLVNLGEITCRGFESIDTEAIARKVVRDIGYTDRGSGFAADTFSYLSHLHGQSPDIDRGVSRGSDEDQGAGDQGMMFGYATDETPELMPLPLALSHGILRRFAALRHSGEIGWLRPDSKAQVSVAYRDGVPERVVSVVLSHMTADLPIEKVRADLEPVLRDTLAPTGLVTDETAFFINPTGRFVTGGPNGDSGLTGRKIIVDTYGGMAAHGGGAFSGKDPSKVDRSAAYYARYAAKNIVAAGLAKRCELQVAYVIGLPAPASVCVNTYGTGRVPDERLAEFLLSRKLFDFRPGKLIDELGLKTPSGWCYRDTAAYGHFGRTDRQFPWERTDRTEALRAEFGL